MAEKENHKHGIRIEIRNKNGARVPVELLKDRILILDRQVQYPCGWHEIATRINDYDPSGDAEEFDKENFKKGKTCYFCPGRNREDFDDAPLKIVSGITRHNGVNFVTAVDDYGSLDVYSTQDLYSKQEGEKLIKDS